MALQISFTKPASPPTASRFRNLCFIRVHLWLNSPREIVRLRHGHPGLEILLEMISAAAIIFATAHETALFKSKKSRADAGGSVGGDCCGGFFGGNVLARACECSPHSNAT